MAEKIDIAMVLEHYGLEVSRTRRGWQKCKCPVHQEDNPSATVNVEIGRFHCFSCGQKGDGLDIIQIREGLDFQAAKQRAKEVFGWTGGDVPRSTPGTGRNRAVRLSDRNSGTISSDSRALSAGRRSRTRRRRLEDD